MDIDFIPKLKEKLKNLPADSTVTAQEFGEVAEALIKLTDVNVKSMDYEDGVTDLSLQIPPWYKQYFLCTLVEMLGTAANYSSTEAFHDTLGPIEIIVQKKWKKTPLDFLHEADALLRRWLADSERVGGFLGIDTPADTAKFLDRVRTMPTDDQQQSAIK